MQIDINLPAPYTLHAGLVAVFGLCPLIAILRGVTPADAADHGRALYEAGFRIVEVPLNSPQPFDSIAAIRQALPADAIVGAGTVLHPHYVDEVKKAGGNLIVIPHSDGDVVRARESTRACLCTGRRNAERSVYRAEERCRPAEDVSRRAARRARGEGVARGDRGACAAGAGRRDLAGQHGTVPDGGREWLRPWGSALYKPGQSAATTASHAKAFINGLAVARGQKK